MSLEKQYVVIFFITIFLLLFIIGAAWFYQWRLGKYRNQALIANLENDDFKIEKKNNSVPLDNLVESANKRNRIFTRHDS